MHDDGARDRPAEAAPPATLRHWSRWLRALLAVQALRSPALGLTRAIHLTAPRITAWLPLSSLAVGLVLALLWFAWLNSCRAQLERLGREPSFSSVGVVWALLQVVPFVGWILQTWVVHRLVADADPNQVNPVTEEREREAGFRQNPVERVETGSVARPLFPLWAVACAVPLGVLVLAWNGVTHPALVTARHVASIVGSLAGFWLVGAVTHNLGELQRRLQAR